MQGGMESFMNLSKSIKIVLINIRRIRCNVPNRYLQRLFLSLLLIQLSACATVEGLKTLVVEPEKIYTPKQLREDLKFLDKSIREIHPEPFSRLTSDKYQTLYDQLYRDLSWPQRLSDFYRAVTPLVTNFSDVHTRVLYPSKKYQQFVERFGEFPLAVLNTSEGMFVVADQQALPIVPVGAEIISINGTNITSILARFKNYVPFETESGQRRMIQIEFSRLYWSVYQPKSEYVIEYRWKSKVFKASLEGVRRTFTQQQSPLVSHYGSMSVDDNTALLWLNDFNEKYDDFDEFLGLFFQSIKDQKKHNLILDLRYNQGGITDNLALMLQYLSAHSIHWATGAKLKLSEQFRNQHKMLLDNAKNQKYGIYLDWLPVEYFNFWQWEILFANDGDLLETEINAVISEREAVFKGNIYVLSNGYCFSACASLITALKYNNLATVVGEPSGSLTDTQYGYPVRVILPNTGLSITIPAMIFTLENKDNRIKNNRLQTFKVERLAADVLAGTDPVFDFTLTLLQKGAIKD